MSTTSRTAPIDALRMINASRGRRAAPDLMRASTPEEMKALASACAVPKTPNELGIR